MVRSLAPSNSSGFLRGGRSLLDGTLRVRGVVPSPSGNTTSCPPPPSDTDQRTTCPGAQAAASSGSHILAPCVSDHDCIASRACSLTLQYSSDTLMLHFSVQFPALLVARLIRGVAPKQTGVPLWGSP